MGTAAELLWSVGIGVDGDIVLVEFALEDVVVVMVAEGVEGFVGVFDGELVDRGIANAGAVDGAVEMGAVAGVLVRRDDEELSDAKAGRELSHGDELGVGERAIGDFLLPLLLLLLIN